MKTKGMLILLVSLLAFLWTGITKDIAEAICKFREENGPFKKAEDLMKVPGITKEVYEEINPQVGTEGDLYTVPRPGEELEEEEDVPLSPSKC